MYLFCHPFLYDKCKNFESGYRDLWYCSRIENCAAVIELPYRNKLILPQIKNMARLLS